MLYSNLRIWCPLATQELDCVTEPHRAMDFEDKVELVTGAPRAIGASNATEFAKRGANVSMQGVEVSGL